LFAITLARFQTAWTPLRLTYLVAGVLGGTLVEAAIQTVVSTSAFRGTAGQVWFLWVDDLFATFANYPLKILPLGGQLLLTYVLPIAFIAYLPAAVVTGHAGEAGVPMWLVYASPLAGPVLFVAARRCWNWALRHYEVVGG
jgi:ABC-2 type transport system permease protein